MFELSSPLLVLLISLIGVGALVWSSFLRGKGFTYTFLLRLAAMLFLAVSAGEIRFVRKQSTNKLLALVDISDSVDKAVGQKLLDNSASIADSIGASLELLPFAGNAATKTKSDRYSFDDLRQYNSDLNIGETNLAKAIEGATTILQMEGRKRALLLSDGWETKGDLDRETSIASTRFYPLVLNATENQGEFRLVQLRAPLIAPLSKSVDVYAAVRNGTSDKQSGTIEIIDGKSVIKRERLVVEAGREVVVQAQSDPSGEGIREIVAKFTPSKGEILPSTEAIFLSGKKRERISVISGSDLDAKYLSQALSAQSYQLDSVVAGAGQALPKLTEISTLVFNNVSSRQLTYQFLSDVKQFVDRGGGFVMIGGERSFGLGGYIHTPIEDILPLEMVPPQTVEKRLNVAVMLVIDKSGSMSRANKLDYATEAAREVIRNLKDEDYVGVVGFDSGPWTVVKLRKLSESRDSALERVGRMVASGDTALFPAIEEAERALVRADAGRKHMIILTDGRLPDAGPLYEEKSKELRIQGITVSTIMLGAEADEGLLQSMAVSGGGRFHATLQASDLPRIFMSDIKVASGEQTAKEAREYMVRKGPAELVSTSIASFPDLLGYVQTKPREHAQLELVAYDGIKAEPLLASWTFGKGRSLAFCSDLNGRWSGRWIDWPRYSRFASEIIDSTRQDRSANTAEPDFDLRYSIDHGALNFDITVFSEASPASIDAIIHTPKGRDEQLTFSPIARGRFSGMLRSPVAGRYDIQFVVGGKKLTPVAIFLSGELFGERKGRGFNSQVLHSIADRSGGVLNPTAKQLGIEEEHSTVSTPLGRPALALALVFLLLEVLSRELWTRRRIGKAAHKIVIRQ